jgi:hypothetical protein
MMMTFIPCGSDPMDSTEFRLRFSRGISGYQRNMLLPSYVLKQYHLDREGLTTAE